MTRSIPNSSALDDPAAAGLYYVQLVAPKDPAPNGRFAIERVGRRWGDEQVQSEYAICAPIDALNRELRINDRVHAVQGRRECNADNLIRRVELRGERVLLHPLRTAPGRKPKPMEAAEVAIMGVVVGTFARFRV